MNLVQRILVLLLRIYRGAISPLLTAFLNPFGFGCRYTPTCSQFALEAVCTHGAMRGSWLTARRLCRCHPWGGSGWDPVPERRSTTEVQGPNEAEPDTRRPNFAAALTSDLSR